MSTKLSKKVCIVTAPFHNSFAHTTNEQIDGVRFVTVNPLSGSAGRGGNGRPVSKLTATLWKIRPISDVMYWCKFFAIKIRQSINYHLSTSHSLTRKLVDEIFKNINDINSPDEEILFFWHIPAQRLLRNKRFLEKLNEYKNKGGKTVLYLAFLESILFLQSYYPLFSHLASYEHGLSEKEPRFKYLQFPIIDCRQRADNELASNPGLERKFDASLIQTLDSNDTVRIQNTVNFLQFCKTHKLVISHFTQVNESDVEWSKSQAQITKIKNKNNLTLTSEIEKDLIPRIVEPNVLVDITQHAASYYSNKILEAVLIGRKILTTNTNIVKAPFFDPKLIRVVENFADLNEEDAKWIKQRDKVVYKNSEQVLLPTFIENIRRISEAKG